MKPLHLSHFTATSCIGVGLAQTLNAMRQRRGGLAPCRFDTVDIDTCVGEVAGIDDVAIRTDLQPFDCRNNRLLQLALQQDGFAEGVASAIAKYGRDRVGVFIGTSTSGVLQTELAYRRRAQETGALPADFNYATTHNAFSPTDFARHYFDVTGPAASVATACSSSAKVFGSARRMIEAGVIDAAIVGGVDSLCLTTLYGFLSLELISPVPCRPYDVARAGISVGEAAAVILLERMPERVDADAVLLLGIGESSDAYHMSSPHPDGLGAAIAMKNALATAQLQPQDIDYINLHGTGTQTNDAAEGKAVTGLFGSSVACSSTKGATGHTLGAAGGLEAVICALAIQNGIAPSGLNTTELDRQFPLHYLLENVEQRLDHVLSNSFGFGGTNCSLVLGRAGAQ
ncbi:MAG TPA: beta-ketoacyl-[acyl-carrier-protein] synthase family protein [Pseudolabrys sp.]|nr:beta-ketoacyl-[acyl-carrier-protein] synthase family protein [Pseudolabrys sp.]